MSESVSETKHINWTEMLEEYFASTGEKAHCLAWCHKKAEALYSNRRTWIDMPVIVISGVTGFLSAGSTTMFSDPRTSSVALGVASLFVSILNTAGSYFGWSKRSEGHRISAIHYSRLYRFVSVELSLPREERMEPHNFLKYVKDQYDRLQEISPLIPPVIIDEFKKKFEHENEISKPEETNGLEKITVYHDGGKIAYAPTPKTPAPVAISKLTSLVTQLKTNPMYKAVALARKSSPDITSPESPAPPPELMPAIVVKTEEEVAPSS